jgi:hypothetical protein
MTPQGWVVLCFSLFTGHKTEGEHQKYTHHEMDNLRAAVKKIPSLG